MVTLLLFPFKVMRERIATIIIPAIPIVMLLLLLTMQFGVGSVQETLVRSDDYLGGEIYLAAANLTAYNDLAPNTLMPLIRLSGMAANTRIQDFYGPTKANFLTVFIVIFLGYLSYAMVSRIVYEMEREKKTYLGLAGVNAASITLSFVGALFILFVSSFALAGLELALTVNFGLFFTFMIPYAAMGKPLGESMYRGFRFASGNLGKVVSAYIACMGIAIMAPVGLLLFTTPIIVNLNSPTVIAAMKLILGLLSVSFALFYQQTLCSGVVMDAELHKDEIKG